MFRKQDDLLVKTVIFILLLKYDQKYLQVDITYERLLNIFDLCFVVKSGVIYRTKKRPKVRVRVQQPKTGCKLD